MEKDLRNFLAQRCKFEEIKNYISDENQLREYLEKEFARIFTPLFVEDEMLVERLIGENNLDFGHAHLWSYRFNRRLGGYLFPEEYKNDPVWQVTRKFFFHTRLPGQQRASFVDIMYILSKKKKPLITFKFGTFEEVKNDFEYDNPTIIIPEELLLPEELRPADYTSEEMLFASLRKLEENVINLAESEDFSDFYNYLVKKFDKLLGADITTYMSKVEILKLFPPVLIKRKSKYTYGFIADLVPDRPSGGFFIRVKRPLKEEQIQTLQFICNFIYGKLALSELDLLKEEEKFKALFASFSKAFETLGGRT